MRIKSHTYLHIRAHRISKLYFQLLQTTACCIGTYQTRARWRSILVRFAFRLWFGQSLAGQTKLQGASTYDVALIDRSWSQRRTRCYFRRWMPRKKLLDLNKLAVSIAWGRVCRIREAMAVVWLQAEGRLRSSTDCHFATAGWDISPTGLKCPLHEYSMRLLITWHFYNFWKCIIWLIAARSHPCRVLPDPIWILDTRKFIIHFYRAFFGVQRDG